MWRHLCPSASEDVPPSNRNYSSELICSRKPSHQPKLPSATRSLFVKPTREAVRPLTRAEPASTFGLLAWLAGITRRHRLLASLVELLQDRLDGGISRDKRRVHRFAKLFAG